LQTAGKTAQIGTIQSDVDGSKSICGRLRQAMALSIRNLTPPESASFISEEDKQLIGDLPADFGQTQGQSNNPRK